GVVAGVREQTTREVEVGWFGAEPLAALPVMRDLSRDFIAVADELDIGYSAKMPTNGSLLTVDKLRILAHECRLERLDITLDGIGAVHDRHRPLRSGGGAFDHIVDVLEQALTRNDLASLRILLRTHAA